MNVHHLPTPARPLPGFAARPRTYGIHDIARALGTYHRPDVWQVRNLRTLVSSAGFPAPLPCTAGTRLLTGVEAVRATARWDRRAVDAWFDGLLPPGAREALSTAAETERADTLDARAENLDDLLTARKRA